MKVRTILVDDELWSMRLFELESQETDVELVGTFSKSLEALSFAQNNPVDCALLDIKMPRMDGITLGRKLKEINRDIIIIYVSAYEEYLREAMLGVKADYFILKPYRAEEVTDVLARAKCLSGRLRKKVTVKTFGEFDLFVDGQLLEFTNQKAKELFAVCIDREGGEVPMQTAVGLLWEDREYDQKVKCLYRKAILYLNTLFKQHHIDYIFCNTRGSCHVNRQEIECDFYEVLDGRNIDETLFDGRYMTNYSWGEETCGRLSRMAEK